MNIGLAVLFVLAVAGEAVAVAQSWGAGYWLVGGCAAVVACGLALARRWDRRWTAVAGLAVAAVAIGASTIADLPAEPGPALASALAVLVGSAVRALRAGWAVAIAGGGLAVVAAGPISASAASAGAVVALNAVAWAAGVTTGVTLRLLDARAAATVAAVRQEERLELARELHDVVAHHITGMLIQAQAAQVVARRDPSAVAAPLAGIEAAGVEALSAMRRVVGLLRDQEDAASASPGPEDLAELVRRFERQGPPVHLSIVDGTADGSADGSAEGGAAWPPEVTSTVYRVVREALTNVARHAPGAGSVRVTVDSGPAGVTVEVADDGPVAAPPPSGGFGLTGMRERVTSLGGTVDAGPGPGGGWTVRATLPLPVLR